jgi:hypothetical protein
MTEDEATPAPDEVEELDDADVEELTEEEMAARLDAVLKAMEEGGDSESGAPDEDDFESPDELEVEDDDEPEAEEASDADGSPPASTGAADLDTPDPAAEEAEDDGERWGAVEDVEEEDLELRPTDEPKTDEDRWDEVDDRAEADVGIEDVEEQLDDPWAPVDSGAVPPDLAVEPPPPLEFPPPVATLRRAGEPRPQAPRSLPWRGSATLLDPDLPDLLYIADVSARYSRLLVAAWEWDESEPGGRAIRLRLSDDGPEHPVTAVAPHEAILDAELRIDGATLRLRLALAIVRDERGLRLGRDALAGRFQVDPARSDWADEEG